MFNISTSLTLVNLLFRVYHALLLYIASSHQILVVHQCAAISIHGSLASSLLSIACVLGLLILQVQVESVGFADVHRGFFPLSNCLTELSC